jgi:hypothetical protein
MSQSKTYISNDQVWSYVLEGTLIDTLNVLIGCESFEHDLYPIFYGGRRSRGRDRMAIGFTITCAISAYHH